MTPEETFYALFSDLPRCGPGSNASTRKAFSLLPPLPPEPQVLDVGCGPGMQTLEVARLCGGGKVTAVDNHAPFLEEVRRRAEKAGLSDRIETVEADMAALPFPEGSFYLVWSEGALYNMGFDKALVEMRRFLKPGACLAASELAWLTDSPPDPVRAFWEREYPVMRNTAQNLALFEKSGYAVLGSFTLPAEDWWTSLYTPLLLRLERFEKEFAGVKEVQPIFEITREEIELHRRFPETYGYVFYVARKR